MEDKNVAIEFRFADHRLDRLPTLAAELVDRKVAAIVTPASGVATLAAKAATRQSLSFSLLAGVVFST
ncbi:MAG: hypothetical protein WA889_05640 [Xanthobacteraceae bacterium]